MTKLAKRPLFLRIIIWLGALNMLSILRQSYGNALQIKLKRENFIALKAKGTSL